MRCTSLLLLAAPLFAAPPTQNSVEQGRREVLRTCQRCHDLAPVAAQRLSREEWNDELRKMISMGARLRNREAVLDFLTKEYGEQTPATAPASTPQP